MSNILESIKELRATTGAGMMDCKKALKETDGDVKKAKEFLRKKGLAAAAKKSGRIAAEGRVHSYIHGAGKLGVLVEVNVETDFAAKTKQFTDFVHACCLQIAAHNPLYITREEIPAEVIEKEKEIHTALLKEQGKPEKIIGKIVDGKINKWCASVCLMDQFYAFEDKKTMDELAREVTSQIGEKVTVRRFVRFEMGEGLEKRVYDLAKDIDQELNK
jgi:elongation factor Ts